MITAVEVSFAVPVEITPEQETRLAAIVEEVARANTPAGHVHWLCSAGHKPTFSQADARFLGKPVDPNAPATGEPEYDDSILSFETHCREK